MFEVACEAACEQVETGSNRCGRRASSRFEPHADLEMDEISIIQCSLGCQNYFKFVRLIRCHFLMHGDMEGHVSWYDMLVLLHLCNFQYTMRPGRVQALIKC